MKRKWILSALTGALVMMIISGCVAHGPYRYGGPPPGYQPPPTPQPPVVEKRTEPAVEKRVPGRVEFVQLLPTRIDRDIRVGARPMNPGGSCDPSLKPFTTRERVYARVQQKGGKWVEGWLPAGTTVFCRRADERNGYCEYQPVEVAKCGNPIEGLVVREYVERVERTEIIHERETVVERVPEPYPVPQPQPMPAYAPCVGPYLPPIGFMWVFNPQIRRPVLMRNVNVNRTNIYNRNVNINRNLNRNTVQINRTAVPRIAPRPTPRPCPPRFAPPRGPRPVARTCAPGYAPRRGR